MLIVCASLLSPSFPEDIPPVCAESSVWGVIWRLWFDYPILADY